MGYLHKTTAVIILILLTSLSMENEDQQQVKSSEKLSEDAIGDKLMDELQTLKGKLDKASEKMRKTMAEVENTMKT